MAGIESAKVYKEEVTKNGAMKIEVMLEEAKKKKRPLSAKTRPGSATSVRSMEDIEKLQQVEGNIYFINFFAYLYRVQRKDENRGNHHNLHSLQRKRKEGMK